MESFRLLTTLASLLFLPATTIFVLTPDCAIAQIVSPHPETDAAGWFMEGDRLLEQGIQQYEVEQFQEALHSFQQALEIYQESTVQSAYPRESRISEGVTLGKVGHIYRSLGQYGQALDFYEQQLEITREIGDAWGEVSALANLGNTHSDMDQYQSAVDYYRQAWRIYDDIYFVEPSLPTLPAVPSLDLTEPPPPAIPPFESLLLARPDFSTPPEPLSLPPSEFPTLPTREASDRFVEGDRLFDVGFQQYQSGQFHEALQSWQQALEIYQEPVVQSTFSHESRRRQGEVLGLSGNAHQHLGQYQQAIDLYEQVLVIFREIGHSFGEAMTQSQLESLLKAMETTE